jgi:glycosyltransferase involved in cell wall biosynthesis
MNSPQVSVVMSVYNGADNLAETLDSVLSQEDCDFEFVVVNDGSDDSTAAILDRRAATDARLRVLHQDNTGLTLALIRGCAEARGDFIARQDAGDISMPGRLRKQLDALLADPDVSFVSCRSQYVGPAGEYLFQEAGTGAAENPANIIDMDREHGVIDGPSHHGSVMFRRKHYLLAGGYRREFYFGQDWDLWYRLAARGKFQLLRETLYRARIGIADISTSNKHLQGKCAYLSLQSFRLRRAGKSDSDVLERAILVRPVRQRKSPYRRISPGCYFIGECLRRNGELEKAREYFRRAVRNDRTFIKARIRLLQIFLARRWGKGVAPTQSLQPKTTSSSQLRILLMSDAPPDPNSGAAGTAYQTILALRRMGHKVDAVWASDLPHRIRHSNLHYLLELPFAYRSYVRARLRWQDYDVVHVNQPHGYLAARTVSSLEAPVFVHRSPGLEPRVREVLQPWRQRLESKRPLPRRVASYLMETLLELNNWANARYADGHIVNASKCADYLHRTYAVPEENIVVVPLAPPVFFQQTAATAIDSRRLSRVLYVGQFAFVKAPMILAEAFERVVAQRPDATLTWVCASKDHQAAAALLGADTRERVTFVDWVEQDKLIEMYDDHGIFLFPSFFEGFGKTFLEAMARGLAVVASDEGGARDLIAHGRNGLLVPVGNAEAMAAGCLSLLSNAQYARDIGQNARETALHYSWDRVAEETSSFYRRLIRQKSEKSQKNQKNRASP